MNKLIVIVGPTGSGKTDLAFEIAKYFNLEIINADAFQVYKEINLGINKPPKEVLDKVKHHLINNISINDEWNIQLFKKEAEDIIDNSKKPIVICGGSNLYIDSLLKNYNLLNKGRGNKYDSLSNEELYSKLFLLDKDEAIKIGKNNNKYLIRSLEIIEDKKILKSKIHLHNNKEKYEYFLIFLNPERESLYKKINERTKTLFNEKTIQEINDLDINKFKKTNASKAIGYKSIIQNDLIINDSLIEKIQQETRNYAKRQVTWVRNKFKINFETKDYEKDFKIIINEINTFLDGKTNV